MNQHPESLEYRVAHLAERLAAGVCGELGVRAEARGGAVLLTGTVPSAQCRDDIQRIAREMLADLPVHCDIVVAETGPPAHAEDLP
ncbi:BON domain-containing protein [Streptomyces melanogenes]|uniref:BON domain-containing protein n=1 Tax=Streptomyces melanogenes TaxID=67326 RepID=A0ABZ1XBR6_9ACTN|nr:BON domain-containing protein [Streptomyces melanogenes]